jgi:adenosine deaminase
MPAMSRLPRWSLPALPILVLVAAALGFLLPLRAAADAAPVARYLDSIRGDPVRLQAFLRDMPKGGDLHSHLSGAVSTESLIRFAVADGLCIDAVSFVAAPPPCGPGQRPAADASGDRGFYEQVIRAWSMEGFVSGPESGHDHFFNAFGKFGAATSRKGDMLAEVASRAAAQNEHYLEIMLTRQSSTVRALAERVGFDADFGRMLAGLKEDGAMDKLVAAGRAETDADFDRFDSLLGCGTPRADPACDLPIRLISQVGRTSAPEVVFAQAVIGFELAERDERYVAINLVAPEDDPVALRDYRLHMRMVGYLREVYRRARVTLHAGELTPEFASPSDLSFHIREAVKVAKAERIGHGVDIAHEEAASPGLLETMAGRHVLVEINLTSNCQILVVCAQDHPVSLYRRSGVPVALRTDDEGIERTDLTAEYQQAVGRFGLGYEDLKTLARAALEHGFLPGDSLWRAPDDFTPGRACARDRPGEAKPSSSCRKLLDDSLKAAAQWRQEAAFAGFERRYGG